MCNLYSVTTNQKAILETYRAMHDRTGKLPSLLGIFPNHVAPERADDRALVRYQFATLNSPGNGRMIACNNPTNSNYYLLAHAPNNVSTWTGSFSINQSIMPGDCCLSDGPINHADRAQRRIFEHCRHA